MTDLKTMLGWKLDDARTTLSTPEFLNRQMPQDSGGSILSEYNIQSGDHVEIETRLDENIARSRLETRLDLQSRRLQAAEARAAASEARAVAAEKTASVEATASAEAAATIRKVKEIVRAACQRLNRDGQLVSERELRESIIGI